VLTEILMICDHLAVAIDVSSRNAGERMDMLDGIRRDVAGLIPEVKKIDRKKGQEDE
jgi:hypothetical protein